jgi:predicted ATPase/DNA-binding winged helix-turn-helix (wHTH) protein
VTGAQAGSRGRDDKPSARRWRFADAILDERNFELVVDGHRVSVDRKPFEVLRCLLRHAGQVVTKEQLAQACWPGRILSDSVLDKTLSRVRGALGDAGSAMIETVRGVGWRLAVPVSAEEIEGTGIALPPNNLPAVLTSLVGREQTVRSACELLNRPQVRLVTLRGCGGIGKTRLCLQLAESAAAHFRDGLYFVDLAPLRSADLLVAAIAHVLQVREAGRQPLMQSVKDHLRDKQMLLLLDNFEQVIAAGVQVVELLAACPRLKIVVTSRASLNVRGEHEFEVPSLTTPPAGAAVALETLERMSAVVLFTERARMVKRDFTLDAPIAADVGEICRRLDGLPLALELAAARSRLFAPAAMLERLARRFELLRDGPRDLPDRQRTLWATVDWSYELLDELEQIVLRRMSVFAGGFTLEAAQAMCAGTPVAIADVLHLLARLVDKSLVQYEDQGQPGRYRLLETIREYAQERLAQANELAEARNRHLQYFVGLAAASPAHLWWFLSDAQMAVWLPRVGAEHDNLRAALAWGLEHAAARAEALRLAAMLCWYWFAGCHVTESVSVLRALLAASADATPTVRAHALVAVATLAIEQGGSESARAELLEYAGVALRSSLMVFREARDESWTAYTLSTLAALAVTAGGDPAEAQRHVEEGLAIARAAGDGWVTAFLTHFLGRAAYFHGDLAAAEAAFDESIKSAQSMGGNKVGEGYGTYCLARIARARGDLAHAHLQHQEALRLFNDCGLLQGIAHALNGLGGVAARRGDARLAVTLLGAVAQWRAALRVYLEPDATTEHDEDLAAARAALDADTFRLAWSEAGSLTDPQVVARALAR